MLYFTIAAGQKVHFFDFAGHENSLVLLFFERKYLSNSSEGPLDYQTCDMNSKPKYLDQPYFAK